MNFLYTAAASYAGSLLTDDSALLAKYQAHLTKYGISYATDEEHQFRYQQFALNDQKIQAINAQNGSFTAAHNKFSTLTPHELKSYRGSLTIDAVEEENIVELPTNDLPAEVDWRAKGAVNPVLDQGNCASCWAFASTATMEAAHFIKTGNLLKLSE